MRRFGVSIGILSLGLGMLLAGCASGSEGEVVREPPVTEAPAAPETETPAQPNWLERAADSTVDAFGKPIQWIRDAASTQKASDTPPAEASSQPAYEPAELIIVERQPRATTRPGP